MADIELVIKIPEKTVNDIKDNAMFAKPIADHIKWDVTSAIVNGAPLPEGHGDLVDIKEVEEYLTNIQLELDGWGDTDSAIEIAKTRMGLDSISPIIKADKEQSDGKDFNT